jgi:hypothetical protein
LGLQDAAFREEEIAMTNPRFAKCVAGFVLAIGLSQSMAQAQTPRPLVPNTERRSGLWTRHMPIVPHLPHDADRDDFYQTRRGDTPPDLDHANCMLTSGLYGLPLKQDCVVAFRPYFWGSPGGNYNASCEKVHWRVFGNFVHPWRPVYSYYAGGAYSPVYDLDPIVPGPGPFPYPLLLIKQKQGG